MSDDDSINNQINKIDDIVSVVYEKKNPNV